MISAGNKALILLSVNHSKKNHYNFYIRGEEQYKFETYLGLPQTCKIESF